MVSEGQKPTRSFIFFKPYGVLCQFTDAEGRPTLADFGPFPRDVYAAGRLDADSEGLVLLTNDSALKTRLTDPRFGHPRTYCVQVERVPDATALRKLREGVRIEGRMTRPAVVHLLSDEPDLPPRAVPIRYRKNIPAAWLEMTLREGRNRQVRRMTAAVGHATLRLVRVRIGRLSIAGLAPGESRELRPDDLTILRKQ